MHHPKRDSDHPAQLVGRYVAGDIVNEAGQLLAASFTRLTAQHLQLFERENISVTMDDVLANGPFINMSVHIYEMIVDEAVGRLSVIYDDILRTGDIPLSVIRHQVVPVIHKLTLQPALFELLATLQTKDDYLDRHTFAVAIIATMLGRWMNLGESDLQQLTTSSLLHNVGYTQLPEYLFNKREGLDAEEYALIRRHVTIGYEMIKQTIGANYKQSLVALQHHERYDGLGYPLGIPGVRTDQFSQVVSVADVFHAVCSTRAYSEPLSFHDVITQLEEDAYGKLDPHFVQLFINKLMHFAIGYKALLTNGKIGKIINVNPLDFKRPLVKTGEQFIDLTMRTDLRIEKIISMVH